MHVYRSKHETASEKTSLAAVVARMIHSGSFVRTTLVIGPFGERLGTGGFVFNIEARDM